MSRKWISLILASALLLTLVACDLQKAALKMFTDEGLTVLEPARDYITVGGIVVVPKNGRPQYIDPYDSLTGTDGTYSNFTAVIQKKVQNKSIGIEAAVGTLASFIPVPAGLNFTTGQQVELSQIDSGGTRLTTQMTSSLLKKQTTGDAIKSLLQDGGHVYMVQEVYTARSMNVKTKSNLALSAAYAGGASVPKCGSSETGKGGTDSSKSDTKSESTAAADKTGSTKKAGATTSSDIQKSGDTTNSGGSSSKQGVGISVGVCRVSDFEISFQAQNPIPFAVRLNEVVLKAGNVLDLKYTGFNIPGALGGGDVSATAIVDSAYPILEEMEHKQH